MNIPTYVILGEPITKKNSQQICVNSRTGRRFIRPSKDFLEYQNNCGYFLRKNGNVTIDYPVNIKVLFYRSTQRRCDLTNLLEAIDDILVRYEVLADDNFKIVAGHDGSRVLIDKDNPRTEIYITRL